MTYNLNHQQKRLFTKVKISRLKNNNVSNIYDIQKIIGLTIDL